MAQTSRESARVNMLKLIILVVDLAVYFSLVSTLVIGVLYYKENEKLMQILWLFSLWAVTLTNMFSMRSINRRTRILNIPGIVANTKLRLIYVGCFLFASIFDSIANIFGYIGLSKEDGSTA